MWLFEDTVLIAGKLPGRCCVSSSEAQSAVRELWTHWWCVCVFADSSFQPKVTFPRSLLASVHHTNLSSVTAYLTVPQRHLMKDCSHCLPAFIPARSGDQKEERKE